MKVLFYTKGSLNNKSLNGINTALIYFIKLLNQIQDFSVDIVTTSNKKKYALKTIINYETYFVIRFKYFIFSIPYLFRKINDVDFVNLANLWSFENIIVGLICLLLRKPYNIYLFASATPGRFSKKKFLKIIFNFLIQKYYINSASSLVVSSKQEKSYAMLLFPKANYFILPNSTESIKYKSFPLFESNLKKIPLNVGYLGRFSKEKNLLNVIDWINKLDQNLSKNFNFVFTGDINSKYGDLMKSKIKENLSSSIRITNKIFGDEQKINWFNKIDILLIQSTSDTCPLVISEALSRGKLILCSDKVGIDFIDKSFVFSNNNTYEGFIQSLEIILEKLNSKFNSKIYSLSNMSFNYYEEFLSPKALTNLLYSLHKKSY